MGEAHPFLPLLAVSVVFEVCRLDVSSYVFERDGVAMVTVVTWYGTTTGI